MSAGRAELEEAASAGADGRRRSATGSGETAGGSIRRIAGPTDSRGAGGGAGVGAGGGGGVRTGRDEAGVSGWAGRSQLLAGVRVLRAGPGAGSRPGLWGAVAPPCGITRFGRRVLCTAPSGAGSPTGSATAGRPDQDRYRRPRPSIGGSWAHARPAWPRAPRRAAVARPKGRRAARRKGGSGHGTSGMARLVERDLTRR